MNYIVSDVKTQRREYTDMRNGDPKDIAVVNGRMLTVEKYHKLARRIIGRWAPPHAKTAMLGSEDAIDFVAHRIMVGDWNYNPDKSNIKTYRGYCGKKAIKVYLTILSKQQQNILTNYLGLEGDDGSTFDSFVDENTPQPHNHMETMERQEEARKTIAILLSKLNRTQRACIIMHYIHEKTMAEIGRELGITREAVRRSISNAIEKMARSAKQ